MFYPISLDLSTSHSLPYPYSFFNVTIQNPATHSQNRTILVLSRLNKSKGQLSETAALSGQCNYLTNSLTFAFLPTRSLK